MKESSNQPEQYFNILISLRLYGESDHSQSLIACNNIIPYIPAMNGDSRFNPARLVHIGILFTILFIVLIVRLYRLQVVQAEIYLRHSETNRARVIEIPPLRGLMYDRNGKLLVDNFPSYTLFVTPWTIDNDPSIRDTLLKLTGIDNDEFEKRLRRIRNNRYTPVRILRDVPFALYAAIEERRVHMPGVSFQMEPKRSYPFHIAPHSLGHIGELKERDLAQYPKQKEGDIVGLRGLEKTWNDELTGLRGIKYIEVDAVGRIIGPLVGTNPVLPQPGNDLILSIDLQLQLLAEELLKGKAGAVVCIEPATGDVLAIVSKPDYPPETFANVLSRDDWQKLQEDPGKPLLHRAVQGVYPPGSIFKMAMLSAGLESGVIDTNWSVTCVGGTQLGRRWFKCWKKSGHGKDVIHNLAIESSCDVYFYLLGSKLGIDRYYDLISRFPFDRRTGIDLVHESAGLLPSRAYLDKKYGRNNWSEGIIYNISIGQGETLVTPLQSAVYASALANGGWWIKPHIVKELKNETELIKPERFSDRIQMGFNPEVMTIVRDDMLRVTEGKYGTAGWLFDPRVHVAGKTGTAQNPHGEDHALFVAFAPFDDPQIALAVVIEHGKHGSTSAAPIAYKLIRQYLGLDEHTWRVYRSKVLTEIANRRAAEESNEEEVQE
ncbi:MAG: penicillin-binding protein 2 [Candidatus Electryonea clarkiae]|nr:penicillin-binding protein 2 [Candidatus Electryonea clarkiae]MDP8288120.1 penicillin-binding protein 2 [Candidatus Electryonea clarkiae]